MRVPFIAGNWKMNTTASETEELLNSLKSLLFKENNIDVAVCPPFPYLKLASRLLGGSRIRLGAQNMYWETAGAYTGEVSSGMLKDAGCDLVILGHSERRQYFGETDDMVHRKIQQALRSGLGPIVCVGETLEEREGGKTEEVVETHIRGCFDDLSAEDMKEITVAYEPVWAIGTGKTASPEQAQDVHRFIREWIRNTFGDEVADSIRIQYGGSVKPENAESLMVQPDIDGALVGGASLKAASFASIVKAAML